MVYTTFCGLKLAEDAIECESFIVISIDSLLVLEKKYYLQVYLAICRQMIDYINNNIFETNED